MVITEVSKNRKPLEKKWTIYHHVLFFAKFAAQREDFEFTAIFFLQRRKIYKKERTNIFISLKKDSFVSCKTTLYLHVKYHFLNGAKKQGCYNQSYEIT